MAKRPKSAGRKKAAKTARRAPQARRRVTDDSVFALDQAQINRALYHEYVDCDWMRPDEARRSGHFYSLSVGELKSAAAEYLDAAAVKRLFNRTDPVVLWKRQWLVNYLRAPTTPFCTLSVLADLVTAYGAHLDRQERNMLNSGYPRARFRQCPWLDNRLSPLLPTRPFDTCVPERRRSRKTLDDLWCMSEHELIKTREAMHACRRDILALVAESLNEANARGICRGAIDKLIRASLQFDMRSVLREEERYAELMTEGHQLTKRGWPFPMLGGVSALMLTVGHLAKEVQIGTFAHTAEELERAGADMRGTPYYFELVAESDASAVDPALDGFWKLDSQEAPFWDEYGALLARESENHFGVSIPVMLPPPLLRGRPEELQALLDTLPAGPLALVPAPIGVGGIAHRRLCRAAGDFFPQPFSHKDLLKRHNRIFPKDEAASSAVSLWLDKMCKAKEPVLAHPERRKGNYAFHPDFIKALR